MKTQSAGEILRDVKRLWRSTKGQKPFDRIVTMCRRAGDYGTAIYVTGEEAYNIFWHVLTVAERDRIRRAFPIPQNNLRPGERNEDYYGR